MKQCREILDVMTNKYGLCPDHITFSTIVKGYSIAGEPDKAMEVLETMRESGLPPDAIIFNTILDGCVQHGLLQRCDEIYAMMQERNLPPSNFTLTTLIKRYGREGNLDKAFELVDTIPARYNFKVNVHVMTCLISASVVNRKIEKALDVFERMKQSGPAPDSKTYEKLVVGCIRCGDYSMACRIVEEAYGIHGPIGVVSSSRNTAPASGTATPGGTLLRSNGLDESVLENLVSNLTKRGLAASHAVPLVQRLRTASVKVPQRLLSATLRGVVDGSSYNDGGKGGQKWNPNGPHHRNQQNGNGGRNQPRDGAGAWTQVSHSTRGKARKPF